MPHPSDVIVIGAGIVGCAVARELARRGASVWLIDDRAVGMGATQASAGILAPYIEAQEGHPLFDLTVRSFILYDDFVAAVASESGLDVPYRRTGTLDVALDESAMGSLRAAASALDRGGVAANLVDAQDIRSEEPHLSEQVLGGLLIPAHGFVSFDEKTGFHNPTNIGFGLNKGGEQVLLSYLPGNASNRVVDSVAFKGQEDLGLLAGGVYFYKGSADGERFTSTYESADDHGRFEMTRPTR